MNNGRLQFFNRRSTTSKSKINHTNFYKGKEVEFTCLQLEIMFSITAISGNKGMCMNTSYTQDNTNTSHEASFLDLNTQNQTTYIYTFHCHSQSFFVHLHVIDSSSIVTRVPNCLNQRAKLIISQTKPSCSCSHSCHWVLQISGQQFRQDVFLKE